MKKLLPVFIFILTFFCHKANAHTAPPSAPTAVSVNLNNICIGGSVSLSATCAAGTVSWYDQATGGSSIGTGTGLSQSPSLTTTYYASCVDGAEESVRIATNNVKVNTPKISALKNPQSFVDQTAFESIDVGTSSVPKLIDLDGDGLWDMLVGNNSGTLFHYEQAAANSMNFSLVTNNFNSIDAGDYSNPAFTDLDSDGLIDLIIGTVAGTLSHYEQASLNSLTFNLVTNTFNGISLGNVWLKPTFTDLDGDGLLDLIVGKLDGYFSHYEQATINSLTFNLVTSTFLDIDFGNQVSPTFTDFDKDGLLDFIIYGSGSDLIYYRQSAANSLTFNLVSNSFHSSVLSFNRNSDFADIDGDGLMDLISGETEGIIKAFEQVSGSFTNYLGAVGSPTDTQTIQVWGRDCLSGNIIVTAPTGFEVSLSEGSGFAGSVSLPSTNGSVNNTTIYVRFNPSTDGTFSGNLQISSTNANTINFGLSGCTPLAPPTSTSSTNVCTSSSSTLTATCASGTVTWYNSNTAYLAGTGSPFVTQPQYSNTTFKVRCEACNVSSFVDVPVTVVSPVAAPIPATFAAICENTSVSLNASCGVGTLKWFAADGTTLLFTGVPYVTPALNETTTYKAVCVNGPCTSLFTDLVVRMISIPTGTSPATICTNTKASLSASCVNSSVKWYSANGTTLQASGSTFLTPNLSTTTTYKVRCESNHVSNCASNFVDVTVTVEPFPTPNGTANATICTNTSASLAASCANGTVKWYSANGSTSLFTGSPFVTPAISVNTTYKVRCELSLCLSPFIDVLVVIVPNPTGISNATTCFNTTASLSAICTAGTVKWYDASGTSLQHTGSPFVTPSLSNNTIYKVRCENGSCTSNFETLAAKFNKPKISAMKNPQSFATLAAFENIDAGSASDPELTDLDSDGLLDMIIGESQGQLVHYKQTAINSMNFELVTSNFNSIDIGTQASPAFTDLDGDGLLDLIVGTSAGTLYHYEQASLNSLTFTLVTNAFNNINIANGGLKPTFTDLDGDGLLDLVIGKNDGTFSHYEQASTNSLTFALVTNSFLDIDSSGTVNPAFTDLDGDGLLDFIVYVSGLYLNHYEQTAANSLTFDLITNNFSNLYVPLRPDIKFADTDGDGFSELLYGDSNGFIKALEQEPGSFTNFLGAVGSPSATQTIQVWGGDCLSNNITVTAPTGFEVSLSPGSGFAGSVALTPTNGSLSNAVVYVRFNPSTDGAFSGNLQINATDANAVSFALSGCTPPPQPATSNTAVCYNTSATLTATCASGTVSWYNENNGILLGTGSTFVTPDLVFDRTYSVRCEACNVSSFVDVFIDVKSAVYQPFTASSKTICNNTSTSLTGFCSVGVLKWYAADETTLLFTGSPFVTPTLTSNTTYKPVCILDSCISISTEVEIIILAATTPTGTANTTICHNTSTSLSASCASGTIKWYNSGGTTLLGSGSPFVTPDLSSNTTYKVRCESGGDPDCASPFADVTVTVKPDMILSGTAITTICYNTSTSLSASCSSGTVKWYNSGGTALQGSGSPFVTPNLSSNTTYKVRCESGGEPNCTSSFSDVIVTVNAFVASPSGIGNVTICSNTSISLSASCATGTIKWYNSGGTTLLGTGSPFATPNLSSTTVYKVRCETGSCEGNFETISVKVNTPKISAIKNAQTFVQISGFQSPGSQVVNMYPKLIDLDGDGLMDMIIGEGLGTLMHYKQSAPNSLNFTLVTNTFNNIDVGIVASPSFTDIDGDGLIDMVIGANATIAHYEQAALNSLTFNLVTNNFNNISVTNGRLSPTFTDIDGDGLLDLVVGKSNGTINHYEQPSANSSAFTLITSSFQGINLSGGDASPTFTDFDKDGILDLVIGTTFSPIRYYKQAAVNSSVFNLVTNSFITITAGVYQNTAFADLDGDGFSEIFIGQYIASILAYEQVQGSFTNFLGAVSNPSASQTVQVWGGDCLSGNIVVTAPTGFEVSLSTNSGFAASVSIIPTNGSVPNTPVYVRFNPLTEGSFTGNLQVSSIGTNSFTFALSGCTPPAPPTSSSPTICYNKPTTLTASCATGTISWYNSGSTTLLGTGSTYTTPNLVSNTTYNVRCEACNVSSFVSILVTVRPDLSVPSNGTNKTICLNTSTSLSATCAVGTVKWYAANGTTLLHSGLPFETPVLNANTTYKTLCESNTCISAFTDVVVTIAPVVTTPTGTANVSICYNTTAALAASCASGTVKWYNSDGTALQGTGSPFVTPGLSSNTPYKVRCESGGVPDCASAFVDVIVTVAPAISIPAAVSVSSTAICSGTNITLSATCAAGTVTWYNQQTGGTAIGTASPLVQSPLITTTYYVSCGNSTCESARVATNQVVVTTQPTIPTGVSVSSTAICSGSSISLSASCGIGTITWYSQQTGGTAVGTGTNFSRSPTTNTTYYVSCKNGVCETSRVATSVITVTTTSSTYTLTSNISSGNTSYIATQTITAINKVISPANAVYKAAKAIMLNPGFEAENGTVFRAYIGGCGD